MIALMFVLLETFPCVVGARTAGRSLTWMGAVARAVMDATTAARSRQLVGGNRKLGSVLSVFRNGEPMGMMATKTEHLGVWFIQFGFTKKTRTIPQQRVVVASRGWLRVHVCCTTPPARILLTHDQTRPN